MVAELQYSWVDQLPVLEDYPNAILLLLMFWESQNKYSFLVDIKQWSERMVGKFKNEFTNLRDFSDPD